VTLGEKQGCSGRQVNGRRVLGNFWGEQQAAVGKRHGGLYPLLRLLGPVGDLLLQIITGAESAFADHRAAGIIREARATMVLATQAYTSLHGSLDRRYADVLMLNLSNELIFTCANHDSASIASKNIGEREVVEKTWGWAAGKPTTNYQRIIKPYFPAFKLRKLPKFTARLGRGP
jgi:hypothetical protein